MSPGLQVSLIYKHYVVYTSGGKRLSVDILSIDVQKQNDKY